MAGTLPDEVGVHETPLFSEDREVSDAAQEIKAYLTCGETLKALITCNRMLSLHPHNKLFEGLRLEVENKEREVRLETVRQLSSDLESVPDLDDRITAIEQALHRYPTESQLTQLLKNATARRDLLNSLVAEARNEELSDGYPEALKRWHMVRELYPTMPGLEVQIRRVESLAETQKKMQRRAEFVDAIFQLSSTGAYARAVYQCINALSEFPNDAGLLTLKKTVEEKAQHSTELQTFISEGVTFLQNHHLDAALESFAKARAFDQSNLQVRYLIGIALLEKARAVMSNDRRKLSLILEEAKSLIPNNPELQTLSFESDELPGESEETSLVRVVHPAAELRETTAPPPPIEPVDVTAPHAADPAPSPAPAEHEPATAPQPVAPAAVAETTVATRPKPIQDEARTRRILIFGALTFAALILFWLMVANRSGSGASPATAPASVDIKATPQGAQIFVDSQKVGESQVQTQLTTGSHTITASLAGFQSQSVTLDANSKQKALQMDLRPIPLDVHIVTDEETGSVWIDDQMSGDIADGAVTVTGVEPGTRIIKIKTPSVEVETAFEFRPGQMPTLTSFPPQQIANVLFVATADGKSHVECNCAPAGLRVEDIAELIRAGGVDMPIADGVHRAELWLGKNRRKLAIHGSSAPAATIAVLGVGNVPKTEEKTESSAADQGRQEP